ncbi:pentatricopeptide repeat protein [Grosmannia clavigera kw1407]|uniref:Pentatricopeptide repeat protein n=1 Tax=Grosmannia clavigera (strain kw1407 / UAMH 11150) TaxID=655863 RepID=F0X6U9_GROCL|nr:pentatricopeptide repeat protein [Grosmannia clavigera kw1407]EFX06514.1 pentatricopeptide repeat protein [Grosmannia clavigera kw1407]
MKASSRFDRSICGALLGKRSPPSPTPPVRPVPASSRCLHSPDERVRSRRQGVQSSSDAGRTDPAAGTLLPLLLPPSWRQPMKKTVRLLESVCRRRPHLPASTVAVVPGILLRARRFNHTDSTSDVADVADMADVTDGGFWRHRRPMPSKKELLSYVDPPADGDSVDAHLDFIRDPYLRRYARPADGPEVVVSHVREDAEHPTWDDVSQADETTQQLVRALAQTVWARLRNPSRMSAAEVYERYRQLPAAERMSCVPASLRHQLLKALGMVEKKDAQSMLRYFAVVADVKDGGFALWKAEWNAAMSFASRYVGSSTATETEAAVRLWREMEQDAHIPGNEVTFNILFDVASKAGNFTLAEMVYQEMERRGLRFNRYHHVSLIHFFGLKMDADGVRTAYREMVEAGEMIDVVVLNCVVAGFLRCGEEDAAERVYQQMRQSYLKRLQPRKSAQTAEGETADDAVPNADSAASLPDVSGFASQKAMTHVLMMLARVSRGDTDLRDGYQHLVPTRPDLATFRILIHHYAVRLGDLAAVTRFLGDMKTLRIPLHGAIFLALFKGFALHGGRDGTGSDWSEQRLRSIWAALLKALDEDAAGLYVSTWLIVWVLRAFDRCSSPESVFKAYGSLTSRWEPTEPDADFAIGFLHNLLRGSSHTARPARLSLLSQLGSRSF